MNFRALKPLTIRFFVLANLCAVLFAIAGCGSHKQDPKNVTERAALRMQYFNFAKANALIRRITAEQGARRFLGCPVYNVTNDYPQTYPLSFPIYVEDASFDDVYEAHTDSILYTGASSNTVSTSSLGIEMRDLRWLVLRTHGVLGSANYAPQGSYGRDGWMGFRNYFTDAWVVDLKNMSVVAHRRFEYDSLPSVLDGEKYYTVQGNQVDERIRLWLKENAR
jgi:hypothetical protein